MGTVKEHFKSEIKQLPFMLGKLAGGIMAVIGCTGTIIIMTRTPAPSFSDALPYSIVGIIGIALFLLSSVLLKKRINETAGDSPSQKDKARVSIISWLLFLAFIAACIAVIFIMTA
jgi:hypothetical protein